MEGRMLRLTAIALPLAAAVMAGISLGGVRQMPLRRMDRRTAALRCAAAAAIALDAGALFLLAYQTAGALLEGPWREILFTGGGALAAAAAYLLPLSLFPEDSGALALIDRRQLGRFTACLWRLLVRLAALGGWLAFLLWAAPFRERPREGRWMLALCAGAAAVLLWDSRQMVKISYERIEAIVDKQYQAELLNFMQVIRSQRHDFNFHMHAVSGMIQSGRYDDCQRYVSEMVRNADRLNDVLPIRNPAISALINTFQELAAGRSVELRAQTFSQLEGLPCTIYEFNSILGNLLQNAIDEAEGKPEEDRWLELLFLKRGRQHIIKVTNPCQRDPEELENSFLVGFSTKQSHEGIGLATVKKIAEKYGGSVHLEHAPGVVRFIVRLPAGGQA